jgi:hypothetical protein
MNRRIALQILGLPPSATLSEARKAYIKLVKQWHPDQYSFDSGLQEDAERALRQVNIAWEFLQADLESMEDEVASEKAKERPQDRPPTSPGKPEHNEDEERDYSSHGSKQERQTLHNRGAKTRFNARNYDMPFTLFIVVCGVVFSLARGSHPTSDSQVPKTATKAGTETYYDHPTKSPVIDAPNISYPGFSEQATKADESVSRSQNIAVDPQPRIGSNLQDVDGSRQPVVKIGSTTISEERFTLGSSESDVLKIQGVPSSVNDYVTFKVLGYDEDSVEIRKGQVSAWSNSGGTLRVVLLPRENSKAGTFSLQSPTDTVISLQGTPTTIKDYLTFQVYYYGRDCVELKGGVVTGWKNQHGGLSVSLGDALPSNFFAIDSTIEELVSAQGTPTELDDYFLTKVFRYGSDSVTVRDGRVISYENRGKSLKLRP